MSNSKKKYLSKIESGEKIWIANQFRTILRMWRHQNGRTTIEVWLNKKHVKMTYNNSREFEVYIED